MATHNETRHRGQVWKEPIVKKDEDGNYLYAMCYVQVVRGARSIDDGKEFLKADVVLVMTKEKHLCAEIETWTLCDIVDIKGNLTTRNIDKPSYCPFCKENGIISRKIVHGTTSYINPIFAEKIASFDKRKDADEYLMKHKEISNLITFLGNVTREPKKIKTKKGVIVTQYQIAANRKFRIRTDAPENKTDFPWVKSYGNKAIEDRERLYTGSLVMIDGVIQSRTVYRKTVCDTCGKEYPWNDRTMEIVPYATEYLKDFRTDEDIAQMKNEKLKNALDSIYRTENQKFDVVPEDEMSKEDNE